MHLFEGSRHKPMDELKRLNQDLKHQMQIATSLKVSVESLLRISQSPPNATDWKEECRKLVVDATYALAKVDAILNPKPISA